MQNFNIKKLTIIAAMLLAAGSAHAADEIDLSGVTALFAAGLAAITAFVAATSLGKATLGALVWGWRKVVSLVQR